MPRPNVTTSRSGNAAATMPATSKRAGTISRPSPHPSRSGTAACEKTVGTGPVDYLSSNSKVLTTRIRFIGVLVGLNGADSSPPS